MTVETCDFCDITTFEGRIIQDGPLVISVLSDPRLIDTTVHALVIPTRQHVTTPDQLAPEELLAMDLEVRRIRRLMLGSLTLMGVDDWTKTRPRMSETTIKRDHVHRHVLGSQPGDPVYDTGIVWTPDRFTSLSAEYRERFLHRLQ